MKKKIVETNYLLISLLVVASFIFIGCNNGDLNSPANADSMAKTKYLNPLRNAREQSRKVVNGSDFALIYSNPSPYRNCSNDSARRFYIKRIVGNSIQYFMDQLASIYYNRVAITNGGLAVAISYDYAQVNIGHFYGDSLGITWTGDQRHGLSGDIVDMTLSEYNELVVFTYNYSTHQIFYSVGLVNYSSILWVQMNQLLAIPTTINSSDLFAADIGNSLEDTLAFVYHDGRTEYRQNCHLNWESDYRITLGSTNMVTCGVPTSLDISLDSQNHCVWVQSERTTVTTTWLCSQPNAGASSWLWTRVGTDRYQPRVSLNNGKAIVLTLHAGTDNCFTTLYNATVAPATYLSETYVYPSCPPMLGETDISF